MGRVRWPGAVGVLLAVAVVGLALPARAFVLVPEEAEALMGEAEAAQIEADYGINICPQCTEIPCPVCDSVSSPSGFESAVGPSGVGVDAAVPSSSGWNWFHIAAAGVAAAVSGDRLAAGTAESVPGNSGTPPPASVSVPVSSGNYEVCWVGGSNCYTVYGATSFSFSVPSWIPTMTDIWAFGPGGQIGYGYGYDPYTVTNLGTAKPALEEAPDGAGGTYVSDASRDGVALPAQPDDPDGAWQSRANVWASAALSGGQVVPESGPEGGSVPKLYVPVDAAGTGMADSVAAGSVVGSGVLNSASPAPSVAPSVLSSPGVSPQPVPGSSVEPSVAPTVGPSVIPSEAPVSSPSDNWSAPFFVTYFLDGAKEKFPFDLVGASYSAVVTSCASAGVSVFGYPVDTCPLDGVLQDLVYAMEVGSVVVFIVSL